MTMSDPVLRRMEPRPEQLSSFPDPVLVLHASNLCGLVKNPSLQVHPASKRLCRGFETAPACMSVLLRVDECAVVINLKDRLRDLLSGDWPSGRSPIKEKS
jgi:hypothetical protein